MAERARVAHEGTGADILACQGSDGPWHLADEPDWLPAFYTFLLLRASGVDPANPPVKSGVERVANGSRLHESLAGKPLEYASRRGCSAGMRDEGSNRRVL